MIHSNYGLYFFSRHSQHSITSIMNLLIQPNVWHSWVGIHVLSFLLWILIWKFDTRAINFVLPVSEACMNDDVAMFRNDINTFTVYNGAVFRKNNHCLQTKVWNQMNKLCGSTKCPLFIWFWYRRLYRITVIRWIILCACIYEIHCLLFSFIFIAISLKMMLNGLKHGFGNS